MCGTRLLPPVGASKGPSQAKNGVFWYQELVQIRYAASTADLIVIDGRR